MPLIMHNFPSEDMAKEYAERVNTETKLKAKVYMDVDKAREDAVYPYTMTTPIVLVDRGVIFDEAWAQSLVIDYGGEFTGT